MEYTAEVHFVIVLIVLVLNNIKESNMKYYIDKWEELPRDVQKEYENLADSLFISPMFVQSIYESGQFGFYETEE